MTNQQILEKAIQKALDGGWRSTFASTVIDWAVRSDGSSGIDDLCIERSVEGRILYRIFPEQVIYDHDFAKAFFGDINADFGMVWYTIKSSKEATSVAWASGQQPAWKKHLQQMVISDDPIKYLGDNL